MMTDKMMTDKKKISIDEIVNHKEITLIRSLECPIDNMVPLENQAVVCKKCETIYCEDCINVWKKTSNICPMRCSPMEFIKVDQAKTIVGQQLQKIRIKCPNDIYGCDIKVLLKDHKTHEAECPYRQETCPSPNCSIKKCYYLISNHLLKECESLKVCCFVCNKKYFLVEIKDHIISCLEINEFCEICNGYHSNTNNSCRLKILKCSKCDLPELSYLIGTPEHICLYEVYLNNSNSLNNYLLQLTVRIQASMDKSQKDRTLINSNFINDFKEKIKTVQKAYFNTIYFLNNKKKKVHEEFKKKLQLKSFTCKENIEKLSVNIGVLEQKIESIILI